MASKLSIGTLTIVDDDNNSYPDTWIGMNENVDGGTSEVYGAVASIQSIRMVPQRIDFGGLGALAANVRIGSLPSFEMIIGEVSPRSVSGRIQAAGEGEADIVVVVHVFGRSPDAR
jgi:hypothetical protein